MEKRKKTKERKADRSRSSAVQSVVRDAPQKDSQIDSLAAGVREGCRYPLQATEKSSKASLPHSSEQSTIGSNTIRPDAPLTQNLKEPHQDQSATPKPTNTPRAKSQSCCHKPPSHGLLVKKNVSSSAHGVTATFGQTGGNQQLDIENDGSHYRLRIPIPLPESFACLSCGYSSKQHRKVKQHWQRMCVHSTVVISFYCSVCGEEFLDVRLAKAHYDRHHGQPASSSEPSRMSDASSVVLLEVKAEFESHDWNGPEGRSALKSVAPKKWLYDEIINFSMEKICVHESEAQGRVFASVSTYFESALRSMRENSQLVGEIFKAWHLLASVLLFPVVHRDGGGNTTHWSLLVIDMTAKCFIHYDSIESEDHNSHVLLVAETLAQYVDAQFGDDQMLSFEFKNASASRQTDGYNCGVYTILHAHRYLTGMDATGISPQDCDSWRRAFSVRPHTRSQVPAAHHAASDTSSQPMPPRSADAHASMSMSTVPDHDPPPNITNPQSQCTTEDKYDWVQFAQSIDTSRILHRIPRGARHSAADAFTRVLTDVLDKGSIDSWERLFKFPSDCLSKPAPSERVANLTTYVKNSTARYGHKLPSQPVDSQPTQTRYPVRNKTRTTGNSGDKPPRSGTKLAKAVSTKLADADVRGAIRILTSTDSLAQNDLATLSALQKKHPKRVASDTRPCPPETVSALAATPKDIRRAIKSFPNGSSGGWDGLRPQHLKDMISPSLGTTAERLIQALERFSTMLLKGELPRAIGQIFFGARLIALNKKSGGIRPIAVGLTIRRLAGKICNELVMGTGVSLFSPRQVGFGVKRGSEGVVHSLREFLLRNEDSGLAMLKIDFSNAFNTVRRDRVLSAVKEQFPEAYPFLYSIYASPSALLWEDRVIWSEEGVQQGDPLGPFLFCLGINHIVQAMQSEVTVFYLDDGCLVGNIATVLRDFEEVISAGNEIGLAVNGSKCECTIMSTDERTIAESHDRFNQVAPGISCVALQDTTLLGAALHPSGIKNVLSSKIQDMERMCNRLDQLDRHDALFLLRHSLGLPRLIYTLRTMPCFDSKELEEYDNVLHKSLEKILNCPLSESQWELAVLPVACGGLGVRRASHVSLPAFLSSVCGSLPLAQRISPHGNDPLCELALDRWDSLCSRRPTDEELRIQKKLDRMLCECRMETFLDQKDQSSFDRAIALAARFPGSGAWLNALPLPQLGLKMSDSQVRIAAGLRVGSDVIHPHACVLCGAAADAKGIHGLSCAKVSGRSIRHTMLNSLIHRALNTAEFRAVLEPPGLSRIDGKRPDGITLVPWRRGRCLMWDASCKSTVAQSNIKSSTRTAGSVAEEGSKLKSRKYEPLSQDYEFVPVVVETHGAICKEAASFISQLGRHLEAKSGESRATEFLRQSISVAIQKGNALSILGTLGQSDAQDNLVDVLGDLLQV